MKCGASLALAAALFVLPVASLADTLADETQHFSVEIPAGFESEAPGTALHRFASQTGLRASISRIDFPNLPAYWRNDKSEFFAGLARGVAKSNADYRLKSKKEGREGRTPVYDLHFERLHDQQRELVWMRFLLFRRYAIVATVTSPQKAPRKTRKLAAGMAKTLTPYTVTSP